MQSSGHTGQTEADVEAESDTGSLPDRLINPEEYEPVLPTTAEHTAADITEDKEPDNEEPRRLTPVYTYSSINLLLKIFSDYLHKLKVSQVQQ